PLPPLRRGSGHTPATVGLFASVTSVCLWRRFLLDMASISIYSILNDFWIGAVGDYFLYSELQFHGLSNSG
ncbi:unnamed protein product, partial [Urochloa humidicola]